MKKKLLLVFLLILGFIAFILYRYVFLKKTSIYGRLKVTSSPKTSIFLNSLPIGNTPFEDKIKEGEYILKLVPENNPTDNNSSQSATWQDKIQIYKDSLTIVSRELGSNDLKSSGYVLSTKKITEKGKPKDRGEIEIDTQPYGSIVYLDNDEKGISPLILENVPTGDHEISVYSPGFFRRTEKISITGGFRVIAKFKLAVDQSQIKIDESIDKKIDDKEASEEAKKKIEEKKEEKVTITIRDTPTGWLRVRSEPSINSSESARINPKETFKLLDEKNGWYKIEYKDNAFGWISSEYADKNEK